MAKFCDKCGTQLPDSSSFCLSCGAPSAAKPPAAQPPAPPAAPASYPPAPTPADFQPVQTPPAYQPPPQAYTPPPQAPPSQPQQWSAPTPPQQPQWSAPPSQPAPIAQVAQTTKSSNTLLKVVLVIVVILGLGAVAVVGGLWYVGHKVVNRVKDAAAQAGINTDEIGQKGHAITGDACRFLSKADVGDAIGVPITEIKSSPEGCSYLAQGTMTDMTSKHVAAMLGQRGVDKKSQDMAQQFAGIVGSSQPKAPGEDSDANGNAVVFGFTLDSNSAKTQMDLNHKILGAFGSAGGSSTITGIGDEAFVSADGMMFVRKGETLIRFMYTSCPCSTEQIKPLAKKLADQL